MEVVSFEIAKKLKEKGFPQDIQYCIGWYPTEYYKNSCIGEYFKGELQEVEDYFGDRISAIHIIENEKKGVIAPTISQVLKWLREEKKISIEVGIHCSLKWVCGVYEFSSDGIADFTQYNNNGIDDTVYILYDSYELAALAGIEYVIDNLI